MPSDIKTAVDSLIDLLRRRKKISLDEASKVLKIPTNIINEWASFLEEEKLLKIEYKFTTPYLIYNEKYSERLSESSLDKTEIKIDSNIENIRKRLENMLSFVRKQDIKHRCEIRELSDINKVLSDGKDKNDILYAQKRYLEYELTRLINGLKDIKDRERLEKDIRKVVMHFDTFKKKM